jgi:hypothetical protein
MTLGNNREIRQPNISQLTGYAQKSGKIFVKFSLNYFQIYFKFYRMRSEVPLFASTNDVTTPVAWISPVIAAVKAETLTPAAWMGGASDKAKAEGEGAKMGAKSGFSIAVSIS